MARKAKGKPLTLRPIRLDDDVWAECQRLGKEHGTINEGLSAALEALRTLEEQEREYAATGDPWKTVKIPQAASAAAVQKFLPPRAFKPPLLKPSEKKR
jgi:hypothetical protein